MSGNQIATSQQHPLNRSTQKTSAFDLSPYQPSVRTSQIANNKADCTYSLLLPKFRHWLHPSIHHYQHQFCTDQIWIKMQKRLTQERHLLHPKTENAQKYSTMIRSESKMKEPCIDQIKQTTELDKSSIVYKYCVRS